VDPQVVDVPLLSPRAPQMMSDPGTNPAGAERTPDVEADAAWEADAAEASHRDHAFPRQNANQRVGAWI
jgi:hypothetical protein